MERGKEIFGALLAIQGQVTPVKQDASNEHFKYKYATLEQIWGMVLPILQANKIVVVSGTCKEDNGGFVFWMELVHESGQVVRSEMTLAIAKQDPQGIGSAITYFRRYLLASMLGIVQDDDDGNSASGKAAKPTSAPRPATPAADTQAKFESAQKLLNQAKTSDSVVKIATRIATELGWLPAEKLDSLAKLAAVRKKALGGKP